MRQSYSTMNQIECICLFYLCIKREMRRWEKRKRDGWNWQICQRIGFSFESWVNLSHSPWRRRKTQVAWLSISSLSLLTVGCRYCIFFFSRWFLSRIPPVVILGCLHLVVTCSVFDYCLFVFFFYFSWWFLSRIPTGGHLDVNLVVTCI